MTSSVATSSLSWHVPRTGRPEPRHVTALKAALYAGSIANLVICNDSAAADCGEVVAQQTLFFI